MDSGACSTRKGAVLSFSSFVLAAVLRRVRSRLPAMVLPGVSPKFVDVWCMDDGQDVLEPALVDLFFLRFYLIFLLINLLHLSTKYLYCSF